VSDGHPKPEQEFIMKRSTTTETTVTPKGNHVLTLPDEIGAIEPKWEIELPGNHVGLVFLEKENVRRVIATKEGGTAYIDVEVEGYRYLVRKKDGSEPKSSYRCGDWRGQFYETPLMLKLAIEADFISLVPKTRQRVERQEDY
jgi:hypothetical protein